jgi:GrpB-like predicted nucleotidyltransferase (UPF0157 family)
VNRDESLKLALDEGVELADPDPRWRRRFAAERRRLMRRMPGAFAAIEHFGSTAVHGLRAKPIIDLLAGVPTGVPLESLIPQLQRCGYDYVPALNQGFDGRRWLLRHRDGKRTHQLHLVTIGSREWIDRLQFRDALRSDLALEARYQALKEDLARRFPHDRDAYNAGKERFIRRAVGVGRQSATH